MIQRALRLAVLLVTAIISAALMSLTARADTVKIGIPLTIEPQPI
jgi:hypothetical protein